MRKTLLLTTSVCLLIVSAVAWTAAQQARPVQTANTATATPQASIEDTLKAVRADLQGERSDIIAKNVTLTAAQAAKFWPLFAQYQKEQDVIMDEQMQGIKRFIDGFDKLDDAGALALINAHLDRDERMVALRKKWMPQFQQALNTKLAVRVMQIDRRLSLAHQMAFVAEIPLVH